MDEDRPAGTPAPDELASAIEAAFEREVGFLAELIRTRSDSAGGDLGVMSETIAAALEALGFTVERHPVPEPFARRHGLRGIVNLIVRRRFGEGGGLTIALHAHGDVVPAGGGWSVEPFGGDIRRGAIWGRGAAVGKADITAYAFALHALAARAADLEGTVELHVTFDEESGGHIGPQWLVAQGLTRPDMVIAGGFAHAVTTTHAGCLHLEILLRGRAAHAATPEAGADALAAATPILVALYDERRRLATCGAGLGVGGPKLTVGTISGGLSINVVPDRVLLRVDRRLTPDEDGEAVEAALIGLIEAAAGRADGIELECRRLMLAEPLRPLAGAERLVELICAHAGAVLGEPVEPVGAPLYSDGRHYAAAGIPTVLYGAGPRSVAGGYAPDEHLELDDLRAATLVVARTLADLLRPR